MDFKFLADTIRNIIVDPVKAWETIYTEDRKVRFTIINLLSLVLLSSVSAFLDPFIS